jgi:hypothetical protein
MSIQSVSQPIGKIMNLRRNVSNIPSLSGSISTSQPIGDIIRLRRNSQNTPGETGAASATPAYISQLIGQTGIRLRRNVSNIPGE